MKQLILIATLSVSLPFATPALAEEGEDGKSLMEQGAELFLRGLTEQMEPALEDLKALTEDMGPQVLEFFSEMGPAFGTLLKEIEDWSVYEAPEILPNGDIIIRRKPEPSDEGTEDEGDDQDTVDL
ncbi:hypothetical protein [Cognatishimia maritima]|uniref:AAA+ family ATPase n=1 Tax=Cognatishimia maritima TaxID=870908 RepID=A0A1M5JQX6_9RHOB|nr:hypothetical protein [Cognatishimia maritima]SHG42986.1 hypothetical protein SAMN04488044_0757 [Cognatishimia maritima]